MRTASTKTRSSRSTHATYSSRSLCTSTSTSPPATPFPSPVEFPSWLPDDKKQDIIDLQIMTLNSPRGRIRRPRIRKRDPNHVPRPMNSFLSYRTEQQHFIRKYCPGANHREISKIVAKWWHDLDEKDKELYREQAASAKLEHAERYPDYKFTPKKKKTKNGEATFKVMDGQMMTTEEILYTNIHDIDYSPLKEKTACAFTGIDPVIAAAASAAQAYPNQYSFQDFLSSTYPFLDQSMLKLLQPYDPNLMPVMPLVDPTLYPEQSPGLNEPIMESAECTPMLEYSESPVDGFLDSPSTAYPPSFPLSNAYGPSIYDNQDLMWNY